MLPEINLPISDKKQENEERHPGALPCVICGKAVTGKQNWIVLGSWCGTIVDPGTASEETGGAHVVGSGCVRKHKLSEYVLKENGNEQ